MQLDLYNSTAAFSPPPVFYEPAARLGRASPTDNFPALRPRRFRIPREGGAGEIETIGGGDPIAEYVEKQIARVAAQKRVAVETERRLRELLVDAVSACEPFSEASLDDLRAFMSEVALSIRPSIFLLDNGNLRAVWRNDAKEQVALQFLGDKVVQYVMFARRENPPMMMRDAGQDTLAHIRDKIAANGCNHLLVQHLMPPAKGSAVPDSYHVLHYISRKHVDPDKNELTGSGFLARPGEGCPSVNWIECFAPPIETQLAGIRAEKRLKYEKRGKLARLNVRGAREYVAAEGATILAFLHDQEDATEKYPEHTSHCVIQGVPELYTPEGELIGDLLLDCVLEIYEVVPG